jgi:dTDP-glucose 4,6-dehydratase
MTKRNLLITGGAGFIGSCFVEQSIKSGDNVVVVDLLTYAGHKENLNFAQGNRNYHFVRCNIGDSDHIAKLLENHQIDAIVNFAAESHVDNSINSPGVFIDTNIVGTYKLLEVARAYYQTLTEMRFMVV